MFAGITTQVKNKTATKSLNGLYGFRITLDLVGVRITDYRGLGLSGVKVEATNPTSGNFFVGHTDSTGSVYMQLDDQTDIEITKDLISKTVQYNGESSPTYTIDIPFLK